MTRISNVTPLCAKCGKPFGGCEACAPVAKPTDHRPFIVNAHGAVSFRNGYAIHHTLNHPPSHCEDAMNRAAADIARELVKSIVLEYHEHITSIAADVMANRIADRVWREMTGASQ